MKKRNILILLLLLCVTLFGCTRQEEEKKAERNTSFGKYTGIYKLDDIKVYVLHFDDTVKMLVYKDSNLIGNPGGFLEDNKYDEDGLVIEFSEEELKVKSKEEMNFKSGTYKYYNGYSTDVIYKDYVGDISYFDDKINGKFKNGDYTMIVVKVDKDVLKLSIIGEEISYGGEFKKKNDKEYYDEFSSDTFTITDGDNVEFNVASDDDFKVMSGKYSRDSKITKEEAIKTLAN